MKGNSTNSSRGYAPPLRFELGPVRALQWLYWLFCLAAVVVLWRLPLPYGLNLLLLPAFAWLCVDVWKRRPELGGVPLAVAADGEGRWWLGRDGKSGACTLLGTSFVSPALVVLNLRAVDARRDVALLITPAAVGDEVFRRLLVRLRIGREVQPDG